MFQKSLVKGPNIIIIKRQPIPNSQCYYTLLFGLKLVLDMVSEIGEIT